MPSAARSLLLAAWLLSPALAEATEGASSPATHEPVRRVTEYRLAPGEHERALAFARARYALYFCGTVISLAVLAAMVVLRVGPRARDLADSWTASPVARTLLVVVLVLALVDVLGLPLAAIRHTVLVRYGISIQGWGSWMRDWVIGGLVGVAVSTTLAGVFYAVVRWSPERAWLWFWLAAVPLLVFLLFVQPLVIAPLFYRFTPLAERHPEVARELGRVAVAGGLEISAERMFEMDASTKLRSVNAYVAGLGASKRIVVWDTTLEKMSIPETLFIFGHEMGHYALGHIPRSIALAATVLLPLFWIGQRIVTSLLERHGGTLGVGGLGDEAGLPLLLLLGSLAGFLATPAVNAYSRWQEHESDVYGLEAVRGVVPEPGMAAAAAFQKLGELGLADPAPPAFVRFWLYTHPPIGERIAFALLEASTPAR